MQLPKDVEVEITFLPTDHGGRKSRAASGYRPQFYYDNHDWNAIHTYIDAETVAPGETVRAYLSFVSPECHLGKLHPGKAFLVREGQKVVGYGSIIRIIELEASAQRAEKR